MEIEYLEKLLPLLRKHNVSQYKSMGFEFTFEPNYSKYECDCLPTAKQESEPKPLETAKIEELVPQTLEEEQDADKILFWSAPGGDDTIPLTGDQPIEAK